VDWHLASVQVLVRVKVLVLVAVEGEAVLEALELTGETVTVLEALELTGETVTVLVFVLVRVETEVEAEVDGTNMELVMVVPLVTAWVRVQGQSEIVKVVAEVTV